MKRKGFTLVELSIVLVIIGLLLGGVMKGKDLISSAEQKKIYNTWLKQWAVTVNEYQDRTGAVLADGTVNGGTAATENGIMDNVNLGNTTGVQTRLNEVGLDAPTGLNNGGSYALKGKYIAQTVSIRLQNSNQTENKNAIYIQNMPTDIAMAFDKMTDGKLDPQDGDFRWYNNAGTTWPDAEATTRVNVYLKL